MNAVTVLIISVYVCLSVVGLTYALSGVQPNSCPRNTSIKKADGSYYQTLQHFCCPDFKEVKDKCIACDPGYYGQNCSHSCVTGAYGHGCKKTCKCNQNLQICHHVDGCVCKPGTMGPGCARVCQKGRFGLWCSEHCQCSEQSECDPGTGECRCNPGYTGETCHDRCTYPNFGDGCRNKCHCPEHKSCHPVSGECACPAGFTGKDCTAKCPGGTFGVSCDGTCACVYGSCDFKDGGCLCSPGYTGRLCDKQCVQGFFGENCLHSCNCSEDRICNHVTGDCHCLEGKTGTDCKDIEGSSTTGVVLGVLFALLIITAVVLYVLYRHGYLPCLNHWLKPEVQEDVQYDDIEDYAEIAEGKMIQNYPYSYADSDSAAPPVKPREPNIKNKRNHYLSLPDADRVSKLPAETADLSDKMKGLSKDYTDLLRQGRCDSYGKSGKKRGENTVSIESTSGYLKPSIRRKVEMKSQLRKGDVFTDDMDCIEAISEDEKRGSYVRLSTDETDRRATTGNGTTGNDVMSEKP